jgi:hypothetical protein
MLVADFLVFRLSALMTALCTCVVAFVVVLAYYHAAPVRKHRGGPLGQSDDVERFPPSFFGPAKFSDTRFAPRDLLRVCSIPSD